MDFKDMSFGEYFFMCAACTSLGLATGIIIGLCVAKEFFGATGL